MCMKCKNIKCNKEHDGLFGSGVYCSRACSNSRERKKEVREKLKKANLGNKPWNTGLSLAWQVSECKYCGKDIKHRKSNPKKYHSDCWLKCAGGYRKGSGVGKSGWYKNIWCDSSYELAWVIYQIDHNIPFERNKEKYVYEWKGKKSHYIPDFIQNGILIEIKGFVNEKTKEKLKSIPNLKILFKKDLNKEFDYVELKYGKDFIKLYEDNPYKQLTSKCKLCGIPCKKESVYCSRKCAGKGNNRNNKLNMK